MLGEIRVRGRSAVSSLLREIKNPAALLAADDFFAALHPHRRLRRDFHVAAGANIVLERDDRGVAFAREKTIEAIEQIFINLARQLGSLFRQLLQPRFQVPCPSSRSATCRAMDSFVGGFLFLGRDFDLKLVRLFHQLELLIFDVADFFLITLDLVPHRGKFVVLARLVLLRP